MALVTWAINRPAEALEVPSLENPPLWTVRDGTANRAIGVALATGPDGKVFTGVTVDAGEAYEWRTIAREALSGEQIWSTSFSTPTGHGIWPKALGVSPDGTKVFVTVGGGWYGAIVAYDYTTIAYEAGTGVQLWTARYKGSGPENVPTALAVSPDGARVFVTGYSQDSSFRQSYATVAYDAASGAQLWASRYSGDFGYDTPSALAVSPDGEAVYVTGSSTGELSGPDLATIAYGAGEGKELWVARYDGSSGDPSNQLDGARDLALTPDGTILFVIGVVGTWDPETGSRAITIAYDSVFGEARWTRIGKFREWGEGMVVSPDGDKLFVTGWIDVGEARSFAFTAAYASATGAELWNSQHESPGNRWDWTSSIALTPDGNSVFATGGSSWVEGGYYKDSFLTVAHDATTGVRLWVAHYEDSQVQALPYGVLDISPDGRRILVGGTTGSPDGVITIAYCTIPLFGCALSDSVL